MIFPWHYYLMASLYVAAGIMHFIFPASYLRVMPRYLPMPKALVYLSGLAEVILGISLFNTEVKNFALYGIILMLLLFLMVHVHMLSSKKAAAGFPSWLLWLRIPLQFGLIYWAYAYLSP